MCDSVVCRRYALHILRGNSAQNYQTLFPSGEVRISNLENYSPSAFICDYSFESDDMGMHRPRHRTAILFSRQGNADLQFGLCFPSSMGLLCLTYTDVR